MLPLTLKETIMDRKMTRRQALKAGAVLAVAAPLATLPFPDGIEPAPVAADTTKTERSRNRRPWARCYWR